ncbi:MAG: CU044_2847 family protein [Thainema sp.]
MKHLTRIQLDPDTVIYVEAEEEVAIPQPPITSTSGEATRETLGLDEKGVAEVAAEQAMQRFLALENTLQTYTKRTLKAFKEMSDASVDKVTLEFGINMGGEAGVPYVTKGTAECSLKVTVESSFSKSSTESKE